MTARILLRIELTTTCTCTLTDALQIAEQAAAMLLVHRDGRLVDAQAIGVEVVS